MPVKKRGKNWYVDFSFQGQRYRKSVGPITKSEATKIETRIRQELIDNYSRRLQGKKDLYSFGEALLRWLKGEAPESMFHHIRAVRPYLENVELSQCVEAVEHMKDEFISKGLAVSTINRRLAVVKRVLNLAYRRWDMLEYPLAEKIEKYSEKGLERNVFLNIDDVEKIINFISDEEVRKAILGYCVSGMRKGELLSLAPGDFQDGCVHLKKQKNNKFSVIPIPSDFHFLFEELPFKATADKIRWHWEKARTLACLLVTSPQNIWGFF